MSATASRQPALPLPCLCLVTDRNLCQDNSLEEKVSQAVAGGVSLVQVREKDLLGRELLRLATRLRETTRGRALLVVNDRVDVALAAEADGVHLPESGLPTAVARRLVGGHKLVGRSVHSLGAAVEAERQGADYLIVGTMFETRSHPGKQPEGVSLLRAIRAATRLPLLAIGGITESNVGQVMEAGADGVAVTSAILASEDPAKAARQLRQAMARNFPVGARR